MLPQSILRRVDEIDRARLQGIALMGSYARGEAKLYSDVDVVCFTKEKNKETEVSIVDDKFLVISFVYVDQTPEWFVNPMLITELLYGVQKLVPLWDPYHFLANLKERALNFLWTREIQAQANVYVCKEMKLLIEEVYKGLQGILSRDHGRMLNALFGLSHQLFKIIRVQKGILLRGGNCFYEQVLTIYEDHPLFIRLAKRVFGETVGTLEERVRDGLQLFLLTCEEFNGVLDDSTQMMIAKVRIDTEKMLGLDS